MFCPSPSAIPDLKITSNGEQVVTGGTIGLPCFAQGSPLQDVRWDFRDVFGVLQYTLEYTITDHANRTGSSSISLHTSDTSLADVQQHYTIAPPDIAIESQLYGMLTISNITVIQAGNYTCTLRNTHGMDSYTAPVEVQRT